MEIEYFQKSDLPVLREITHRSFPLNSFNVDSHLPRLLRGEVFFETMAKKAMQENSRSCLVARHNGRPLGYIIYGIDQRLSDLFSLVTATVMLFCVAEEAQGKGVGRRLLQQCLQILRARSVSLITVGTDGNNIAALNLYQESGFRTRMNWGTFRFYPDFQLPLRSKNVAVVPYGGERDVRQLARYSDRPIAFFRENKIPLRNVVKFRNYIQDSIVEGIQSGQYWTFIVKQPGLLKEKVVGLLTCEQEHSIQPFFPGESKRVFRINDIVVHAKSRGQGIGTAMVRHFLDSVSDYHFVEVWASMDNWALINVLEKCGFRLAHLATVLHCYIAP